MACVLLAVLPLLFILGTLLLKGRRQPVARLLHEDAGSRGESGGGVANAIVGTMLMVGTACLIGIPVGIGAGVFASEFPGNRLSTVSRFVADVLNGTPSIVIGVFAWTWLVARPKHFSGFAGSVALAILMVPMVMRTTEEIIKLVPHSLREAALALGYQRWRTTLQIVLLTALPGILTGALLAVARIAGETAPLLFTALGSQYMGTNLNQPMASLPLTVYTYATGRTKSGIGMPGPRPGADHPVFVLTHGRGGPRAGWPVSVAEAVAVPAATGEAAVPPAAAAPRLESDKLSAMYGKFTAVKNISLAFAPNRVHALIGPSGCGKSTFLRTLNRMHEMSAGGWITGRVLLDGEDVYASRVSAMQLRKRVGMVFQSPTPFPP
jgi:phosphate transport system permease protein